MKKNLTETITGKIEYKILTGEYAIGEKLPTLREMTDIFGVSRSVINAAIIELSNKGYIKVVPTKWIEVANWRKNGTLAILNGLLEFDLLSRKDIDSLLESRLIVEVDCVRLACRNRSEEDIKELEHLIKSEDKEMTIKDRVKTDLAFHHLISVVSGNIVFPLILKSLEKNAYRLESAFYSEPGVIEFVISRHNLILDAIKNKDEEEAANRMRELLKHGERYLALSLDSEKHQG